jgi:hypothetical protein
MRVSSASAQNPFYPPGPRARLSGLGGGDHLRRALGLTIGHTEDQLTLPPGVMATLDAGNGEPVIEEPAVE